MDDQPWSLVVATTKERKTDCDALPRRNEAHHMLPDNEGHFPSRPDQVVEIELGEDLKETIVSRRKRSMARRVKRVNPLNEANSS